MTEASKSTKQSADMLGQYLVTGDIAEGTFGKVKMATHILTGQTVAMKYLSRDVIAATHTKARVHREVEYMRFLKHPHIIKLYEVISTPKHIIIVLEYAGGELFNYIEKHGKMAECQARRFFQQLMSGIEYSHRLKVVHRDLKPENVLLDDQLNVKIVDFGLSNAVTDGEFLQTSCGSPNYAAPEVILGLRYTGPEIDVWSCGVILYVMLCARLPFEDENVNALFAKITQGHYHEPAYLSHDAKTLLASMLAVDPVKRITVSEILESNFFKTDLPRYLTPLPRTPPVLGTLSSLVSPPKALDFEIIEGLGRIEEEVVKDLADRMEDITIEDVWKALRMDDGVQGNAVKVAYMLLRDKGRAGRDLAEYEEQERDARIAAMDPSNNLSPLALSPAGIDSISNPFDISFIGGEEAVEDDDDDELDDGIDWVLPQPQQSHFAVLGSSLPGAPRMQSLATRNRNSPSGRERRHRNPKWHFGIRSRSPRMEVMLEIYRTLQVLGMEWREKRSLGGLGGVLTQCERLKVERRQDMDGKSFGISSVDNKVASSIYFVETRARVDDIIVLMDLQLYQVDEENYLVDFKHQGYYKASVNPGSQKFDRAPSRPPSSAGDRSSIASSERESRSQDVEEIDKTISPFLFIDVACRLIIELAGGGESATTNNTGEPNGSAQEV